MKMSDEGGFITLDFIFALFMTLGFASVFFAVTLTLSFVEVGQYVTFATSRAYLGAHENKTLQTELGKSKFNEVMAKSAFKTFLAQDWFRLSSPDLGDFSSEYPQDSSEAAVFVGARVAMDARLLHLNVPFLGSTATDSNVGKATLNSYLMREVSTEECRENFTRARYSNLRNLSDGGANYSQAPGATEALITDNGC